MYQPLTINLELERNWDKQNNLSANKSWLKTLWTDFKIIFARDPAANNWLEVVICYPGLHALALHRLASWLLRNRMPLLPRFLFPNQEANLNIFNSKLESELSRSNWQKNYEKLWEENW